MPFASKAQQRYFYANRKKLEQQGVDVDEWSKETDYSKLPEKKAWAAAYAKMAERLHGGRAAGKQPGEFPPGQLAMGQKVEMEHTTDPEIAREIAMDHLAENDQYYTYLKRMEDAMPKKEACWAAEYLKLASATSRLLAREALLQSRSVPQRLNTPPANVSGLGSLVRRVQQRKGILPVQLPDVSPFMEPAEFEFTKVSAVTGHGPRPSGTWPQVPLTANPYQNDPEGAAQYENGYEYAQSIGPEEIRLQDPSRWARAPIRWREGFVAAAKSMGVGDLQL